MRSLSCIPALFLARGPAVWRRPSPLWALLVVPAVLLLGAGCSPLPARGPAPLGATATPVPAVLEEGAGESVELVIAIHQGAAADPLGKEGLAALTAWTRAQLVNPAPVAGAAEAQVGQNPAGTGGAGAAGVVVELGAEWTLFRLQAPLAGAEAAAQRLAGVVSAQVTPPELLQRVRAEVDLAGPLGPERGEELLDAALYLGHPAGRPMLGTPATRTQVQVADLEVFRTEHYLRGQVGVAVRGPKGAAETTRALEILQQAANALPTARVLQPTGLRPVRGDLGGRPPDILVVEAAELGDRVEVWVGEAGLPARYSPEGEALSLGVAALQRQLRAGFGDSTFGADQTQACAARADLGNRTPVSWRNTSEFRVHLPCVPFKEVGLALAALEQVLVEQAAQGPRDAFLREALSERLGQQVQPAGAETGAPGDPFWERRLLAEVAGWGPPSAPDAHLAGELVRRELDPKRLQIVLVTSDPARLLALLSATGSRTLRVFRGASPTEPG